MVNCYKRVKESKKTEVGKSDLNSSDDVNKSFEKAIKNVIVIVDGKPSTTLLPMRTQPLKVARLDLPNKRTRRKLETTWFLQFRI